MKKILFSIFFLLAIIPVMASDGNPFTVFGRVTDTDGTPINGVTVVLSVSGGSNSTTTANVTQTTGGIASGYYVFQLANLPVSVNAGDSMTITATATGKSASWTGPRAALDDQEENLQLSTGSSGSGPSGGGGGGPSGGGGGGGTSGENYSNIQAKESKEEFIAKDLPTRYNFTTPILPVYQLEIIGAVSAGLINTQIELLKDTSTLVKTSAPGTVYRYVNIWVGTSGFAVPKNIKEATVRFKVENSWLISNEFKDTDVALERWDGTKWELLETGSKGKDELFTHFEAKTNSFSPFAITSLKGVVVPAETPVAGEETPQKPGPTAVTIPVKKTPGFNAAMAMILLLAGYMFGRKR
ncbi:MAG: PGF-pre-PGF domain-containing protein [Candidatus Methanoperedens sp.]|nr:PGF-pre-PGF domain-containing protein [Candidatus Methanoperedens sp.]MCZ7370683.1 PGF-pre-PGF domain-containing protein [Candidatus Methanoperedens sp.]